MSEASADRLRTRIGRLDLPNPIICGSGEHVLTARGIRAALAAGCAVVIAKSLNESPDAARQLDHADYALIDGDGRAFSPRPSGEDGNIRALSMFCRSGLARVDRDAWLATIGELDREAAQSGRYVAASVVLANADAAAKIAAQAQSQGIRLFELNVGAPHGAEAASGAITIETHADRLRDTVAKVRAAFQGTLWVKLGGVGGDAGALARASRDGGADAVTLAGRHMAFVPDVETLQPLLGTSAAYGGQWALPIICRHLALARRAVGEFPLLATNGARTGLDVARFILAGAGAVQMTSAVFLQGYGALSAARDELEAWLVRKDLHVQDVVGRAADALTGYFDQPARPGRWRDFVPTEGLE